MKFSIITAIYNCESYLSQSIESVINQDIGFKDNIQLILVDDGSTDKSKDIALKYKDKFPENIIVLSKQNGGPGSARNMGLDHACGEYVNFLDGDDMLSSDVLSSVYAFFDENDVDVVSIPLIFFERFSYLAQHIRKEPLSFKNKTFILWQIITKVYSIFQ